MVIKSLFCKVWAHCGGGGGGVELAARKMKGGKRKGGELHKITGEKSLKMHLLGYKLNIFHEGSSDPLPLLLPQLSPGNKNKSQKWRGDIIEMHNI